MHTLEILYGTGLSQRTTVTARSLRACFTKLSTVPGLYISIDSYRAAREAILAGAEEYGEQNDPRPSLSFCLRTGVLIGATAPQLA